MVKQRIIPSSAEDCSTNEKCDLLSVLSTLGEGCAGMVSYLVVGAFWLSAKWRLLISR